MAPLLRTCALAALAIASFGLRDCNVLDFGAKGDNSTEDTEAVQAAVNNCSLVWFPAPGKYLIRPINVGLHDNLTLQIDNGATLIGWSNPDTYNTTHAVYPLLWTDGWRNDSRVPMTNLTITGGGTIDGQGWRWWPFLKTRPRPILINIAIAQHLRITNVTLLNSPSFHIQVRLYRACVESYQASHFVDPADPRRRPRRLPRQHIGRRLHWLDFGAKHRWHQHWRNAHSNLGLESPKRRRLRPDQRKLGRI